MQYLENIFLKIIGKFPGGPLIRTWPTQCQGPGFDPWLRNQDAIASTEWLKNKRATYGRKIADVSKQRLKIVCSVHPYTCMLSHFSHVQFFVTRLTVACQAPLSMGFSRQEYWSGLPCPPPGDLPDPGIEPGQDRIRDSCISCTGRQILYRQGHLRSPSIPLFVCKKMKYVY